MRLTPKQIEALQPRATLYELTDPACVGLKLRVAPSGAKVWVYRFHWERRRQLLTLGIWPAAESRKTGRPFKTVVNDYLRAGLAQRRAANKAAPFRVEPVRMGALLPGRSYLI